MFSIIQGNVFLLGLSGNVAEVSASNRLKVETQPPTAPADTIQVSRQLRSSVNGSTTVQDTYVIPNKMTLNLLGFMSGIDGAGTDRSNNTLYASDNGIVDANSIVLSSHYANIGSYAVALSDKFDGNGTRAVIAERRRINASAYTLFIRWTGYLTYQSFTVIESGISPTVTATSLTKDASAPNWSPNVHVGRYVILPLNPPLLITANTASTLTFAGNTVTGSNIAYQIVTFP